VAVLDPRRYIRSLPLDREGNYFPALCSADRAVALLNALLELAALRVPLGVAGQLDITVTSTRYQDVPLPDLMRSVTLINDGPDAITYRLPKQGGNSAVTIRVSEVHPYAFEYPVVPDLAIALAPGGASAALRIIFVQ
jgi:hypothetical protein